MSSVTNNDYAFKSYNLNVPCTLNLAYWMTHRLLGWCYVTYHIQ